ncbi:ComEC/Rec2 family competence protein [Psychrobacter fjordensis]|uniref:ComEC/Rec2 family competence protein n=1 Tax=Psychrobacter fjordensis TaxID=664424 RepID=UPI0019188DC7|nr:MBL fold metallo-hydrolase [Psychrobacter fjordensis]
MLKIHVIDAAHGDCILIDFDHSKILIDCGPKSFKVRRGVLANIEKLLGEHGTIDIAVVTHNDDDHIGGYKFLLDTDVKIGTIIFNSLQDIPNIVKSAQKQISYSQDHLLRKKLLEEKGIQVQCLTRDSVSFMHRDIKLTAITPTVATLEKMLNNSIIKEEKKRQKQISSTGIEEVTLGEALKIIKLDEDILKNDPSVTNKSSISLIIEYKGFTGIFLGDAHAEDVIEGLKIAGFENHKFDLVKVSHHGSERNTSTELLELIGKSEYIICANNETNHNHPNNITLARILSLDSNPAIHLSSNSSKLLAKIEECKNLNFDINETSPTDGVNTIYYEYK